MRSHSLFMARQKGTTSLENQIGNRPWVHPLARRWRGRKLLRKKASVEVFYHSYRYSLNLRFPTSLSLGESLYSRKLPTHGCGTRRLTQESRSDLLFLHLHQNARCPWLGIIPLFPLLSGFSSVKAIYSSVNWGQGTFRNEDFEFQGRYNFPSTSVLSTFTLPTT